MLLKYFHFVLSFRIFFFFCFNFFDSSAQDNVAKNKEKACT